nr:uncharacterized protein Ervk-19 [Marmota flaviventris]
MPVTSKKVICSYPTVIALLIIKGRHRSRELFGKEMHNLVIPYSRDQLNTLMEHSEDWQIALQGYCGHIKFHLPSHPLLYSVKNHPVTFPKLFSSEPLPQPAALVFTDGSSNGRASLVINDETYVQQTEETSAQRAEIIAVIMAFTHLKDQMFNLYTDSQYIVEIFPHIETASLPQHKTTIFHHLNSLQKFISDRQHPYFIGHIRGHSNLPGELSQSNALADSLTRPQILTVQGATASHALHHQNASALRQQFHIPRESARTIVRNCQTCPSLLPALPMGVNPRGLRPDDLWQMDVTHIPSFGKLSYVHVVVDTFSHVIIASARTREAYKDVVQHLFICFSYLAMPKALKTDNAPAYTSNAFKKFCDTFKISHSTGIPYNPQGQARVERAHQTLKAQITKLQEGEYKYSSPHHVLQHALFVISHLNCDYKGVTPMLRHWENEKISAKPLVKWKDLLTGKWKGPDVLLTCGRGYACVFPQDADSPIWIPDRLIRPYVQPPDQKAEQIVPSESPILLTIDHGA